MIDWNAPPKPPIRALVATKCAVCARPLTDAASVERGVGPSCAKMYGFGIASKPTNWGAVADALGPFVVYRKIETDTAHKLANQLVYQLAAEQRGHRVPTYILALHLLGYVHLAERIASRIDMVFATSREGRLRIEDRHAPISIDEYDPFDDVLFGLPTHQSKPQGNMITVKDLSPDQRVAYDAILKWVSDDAATPILSLGGVAGSGKSSLTGIIGSLPQLHPIAFATFTGKASGVLRKKLSIKTRNYAYTDDTRPHRQKDVVPYCGTLHTLLYVPIYRDNVVVGFDLRQELDADYKLIITDESSMIDDDMLIELRGFGIPILAVGDHAQLPPVGGRGSLMENPMLRLEQIHRQAEGNPIIALSKMIRETGRFGARTSNANITYGKVSNLDKILAARYQSLTTTLLNKLVTICHTNARRTGINMMSRKSLGLTGAPQLGEQVVCLKNIKSTSIYNGMRGIVKALNGRDDKFPWQLKATINFVEDDVIDQYVQMCIAQFGFDKTLDFESFAQRLMQIARKDMNVYSWSQVGNLFDFGYALTVNKSQGSQWDDVLFVAERPHFASDEDWRRFCYTAVTRSASTLTVLE